MDIVFLQDLQVEAVVGIHDWERVRPRRLRIDLEMAADIRGAALSDNIADALDYDAVAHRVTALAAESRFNLIETLAEHLARNLREEYSIPWLRLRLVKPGAVRGVAAVGVVIERGERP